jgi:hypothetical protein
VESPCNICKIKDFEERITVSYLRRVDSVFPDNGAKILSHNLYLPKIPREVGTELA